jgi:predicted component of type VI protein secretion system
MKAMKSRITTCALFLLVAGCGSNGSLGDPSPSGPVAGPDNSLNIASKSENTTAKNYGCAPVNYRTAGSLLIGLGVDLKLEPLTNPILPPLAEGENGNNNNNGGGEPTKAQLAYRNAKSSFGVADYINRNPEATQVGTAQLAKMGDLFIESSTEIVAKFGTSPRCGGLQLFDGTGHFTREGLSCLAGEVASLDSLKLANQLIDRATGQGMTQANAQELVVAGYLSAQFTCR